MRKALLALTVIVGTVGMVSPAFAAGGPSAGGGGGGGGTGGGGGGGGGTTAGAIRTVGSAAACDGGSVFTVTLRKGFQKRVEEIAAGNFIGGRWEIHLTDVTHGMQLLGMATSLPTNSVTMTSLGGSVPVGTSQIEFIATRRENSSTLDTGIPLGPLLETCTASFTVVAA